MGLFHQTDDVYLHFALASAKIRWIARRGVPHYPEAYLPTAFILLRLSGPGWPSVASFVKTARQVGSVTVRCALVYVFTWRPPVLNVSTIPDSLHYVFLPVAAGLVWSGS